MNSAIKLYPYQRLWFEDQARFKIGMFARQTGKTFTTCGEIVDDIYAHELAGKRTRWVILSRGERQAKEAMDEGIKPWAKGYQIAAKGLAEPKYYNYDLRFDNITYKALEVSWPNGSRITALPANPDTARGFSSNVFLDEFAFHKDSNAIWKALFPVISNGYKIRITSTPNGKGNKFYQLMTSKGDRWSRHTVDIHRAVNEGLPRNIDELKDALADEDAWRQEFELDWLDEASSWLGYDLIASVENDQAGKPEQYQGGMCFVGVDIAVRRNLFVIWVVEQVNDILVTREVIVRKRISFSEQDHLLASVFDRYRVVRCRMDQTGMGEKPVEDAKHNHGKDRVEGILFSTASKLDMATTFKEKMQDRKLQIPSGDIKLRADLHAIKSQIGPTGIRRLIADTDTDGHADRFWAAAMAVSAAKMEYQPYAYRAVPRGGSRDRPRRSIKTTAGFSARKGIW